MKQLDQPPSTQFDLDAIGLEVDAAEKGYQHSAGLVGRHGHKLFCDLAGARDQVLLLGAVSMFVADDIEDCSLIRKEGAKPVDHKALEIAGGDATSV